MTPTQLQTLKTDITVTRASTVYQGLTLLQWWNANTPQADDTLARFYNGAASPVVKIWNPRVPVADLTNALVMSEYVGLTVGKQNGWFVMTQGEFVDATLSRVRQNFIDIFGGGATTTANLTAAAQKNATYAEALFSTAAPAPGTGSISEIFGETLVAGDIAPAHTV